MMQTDYATYFAKFLRHTNEKRVFIESISEMIRNRRVQSVLDIGAGNGELSAPLSRLVTEYMAVEHNPSHIIALEQAGLTVIPRQFPCGIRGNFDFVLASHVLSYQADNQREFTEKAFEKVSTKGALLIITFRSGERNEWTDLIERVKMPVHEQYATGFAALMDVVRSITDDYVIRKVRTEVRTDTLDDMVQALAFVASDGVDDDASVFLQRRMLLEEVLDEQYRPGSQYVFPFDHFFIQLEK